MDQLLKLLESLSNPILTACGIYIAKSLHELNLKIAVIIEKVDSHEHRINRLEVNDDKREN